MRMSSSGTAAILLLTGKKKNPKEMSVGIVWTFFCLPGPENVYLSK